MSNELIVNMWIDATQAFRLVSPDAVPLSTRIEADFSQVAPTLDPPPPCAWRFEDLTIEQIAVHRDRIVRRWTGTLRFIAQGESVARLQTFLAPLGYFDRETGEFDWPNAANFLLADTALCPPYAEFEGEDFDIEADAAEVEAGTVDPRF